LHCEHDRFECSWRISCGRAWSPVSTGQSRREGPRSPPFSRPLLRPGWKVLRRPHPFLLSDRHHLSGLPQSYVDEQESVACEMSGSDVWGAGTARLGVVSVSGFLSVRVGGGGGGGGWGSVGARVGSQLWRRASACHYHALSCYRRVGWLGPAAFPSPVSRAQGNEPE